MSVNFGVYNETQNMLTCVDEAPSANLSNVNARTILNLLGLDPGEYLDGIVPDHETGALLAKLDRLVDSDLSGFVIPTTITPSKPTITVIEDGSSRVARPGSACLIDCGIDADGLRRRLLFLRPVIAAAHERKLLFGWC